MPSAQDDAVDSRLFFPPLWKQRRSFISKILLQNQIESVLDLGTGEGALLEILLNEPTFQRLAGVDSDPICIGTAIRRCQPRELDRRFLRELPVQINLFDGSIDAYDHRCLGYDAITMIEVYVFFLDTKRLTFY